MFIDRNTFNAKTPQDPVSSPFILPVAKNLRPKNHIVLSGPHAIFVWRIAVAHDVGHSQKPPSNFFHGRAGFPSHFLALITLKTFE